MSVSRFSDNYWSWWCVVKPKINKMKKKNNIYFSSQRAYLPAEPTDKFGIHSLFMSTWIVHPQNSSWELVHKTNCVQYSFWLRQLLYCHSSAIFTHSHTFIDLVFSFGKRKRGMRFFQVPRNRRRFFFFFFLPSSNFWSSRKRKHSMVQTRLLTNRSYFECISLLLNTK